MTQKKSSRGLQLILALLVVASQAGAALAQDGEAASSPAGLSMLILFLGLAGIIGVFVIRWSQSTGEDDQQQS